MTYQTLQVEHNNAVMMVSLNRPEKRNAMNATMISELMEVMKDAAHQSRTHVLLIKGAGSHFCAGADIESMQKMTQYTHEKNLEDAEQLATMLYTLHHFPKPTMALIQGAAMGGGLGLLSAVNIALCTESCFFGFSEVNLGLAPSTISPYVVKAMGERLARYYFLTGERFDAKRAYEMGLIHEVLTDEIALQERGLLLAKKLAAFDPSTLTVIQSLLTLVTQETLSPALSEKTAKHLATRRETPEAKAGLNAFLAKHQEKMLK